MNTRVRTNTRLKQSQFNGVSRCTSRVSTRTLLERNRTLKRNSFNTTQRFLVTKKNLGTEMAASYNPVQYIANTFYSADIIAERSRKGMV
jgi:hypothetical protein